MGTGKMGGRSGLRQGFRLRPGLRRTGRPGRRPNRLKWMGPVVFFRSMRQALGLQSKPRQFPRALPRAGMNDAFGVGVRASLQLPFAAGLSYAVGMAQAGVAPIQSLYVHVPFCAQKCSYCAFYSEASSGEVVNRYVEALVRELGLVAADLKPATIFFGGGTPSLLNLRQWETILGAMERLNLLGAAEWTVECNPATVSLDKARLLRSAGVNRVSMGVQSLNAALLERLGRVHTREMVFKSFDVLRQAGFGNLNIDLMFAIPGQTLEVWCETLAEALAMGSEHLSSYEVIYEEDTALYAQLQAGEFAVDEELACAMYDELVERATTAGFRRYEVANFARPATGGTPVPLRKPMAGGPSSVAVSLRRVETPAALAPSALRPGAGGEKAEAFEVPTYACRHNVNYWRGGSFYGLGPSATSYVRGVRTKNWSNTQLYCEQLEKGKRAVESQEQLPPLARAGETAAFGLRMAAGWPFAQFEQATGHDLRRDWSDEMEQLTRQGWGVKTADRFALTSVGLRFADAAAQMFLR
jgi:oxygen-independent coproporphyrinogen III oxidase